MEVGGGGKVPTVSWGTKKEKKKIVVAVDGKEERKGSYSRLKRGPLLASGARIMMKRFCSCIYDLKGRVKRAISGNCIFGACNLGGGGGRFIWEGNIPKGSVWRMDSG